MMRQLRNFLVLPIVEQWLFVEAVGLILIIRFALFVLPFRIVRSLCDKVATTSFGSRTSLTPVGRIALLINTASHYTAGSSCLPNALATRILLTRRGVPNQFIIGVTKDEQGVLAAHAWVESQGSVVIGRLTNLASYTRLPSLEHRRR